MASNTNAFQLFVGDLPPSVREDQLGPFLESKSVETLHIKVPMDYYERNKTLRYAYVTLPNDEMLKKMLELNLEIFNGFELRIARINKNAAVRRGTPNTLYVKNIPKDVSSKQLIGLFSEFGKVLNGKHNYDKNQGISERFGYGFIQFEETESLEKAIEALNDKPFPGRADTEKLLVTQLQHRKTNKDTFYNNVFFKFVTNDDKPMVDIGDYEIETDVQVKFKEFGEIISVYFKYEDQENKKNWLGWGCVCFKDFSSAQKAVETVNGSPLENLEGKWFVCPHESKSARMEKLRKGFILKREQLRKENKDKNLLIKNLPANITDEKFSEEFSKYGEIVSCTVCRVERNNSDSQSTGYGFVCYKTKEEAERAIQECDRRPIFEGKPIFVSLVKTRRELAEQRARNKANVSGHVANPIREKMTLPGKPGTV
eukprot:TRINITY_DN3155_c1_g3_i1.p1 TRINITY_DN3155_c1_g3~~TRINITY_DN3155_c1_g3_i1.p1  ORF type:complete len:437 (-),score=136.04 TRINITY_DN3155_c1_g3_i1:22-1305(-)